MEQYIVSSNSALELKLGNYKTIKKKLLLKFCCIPNIYLFLSFSS